MLKDKINEDFLRERGYVVIPFLKEKEILEIQEYYDKTYESFSTPFHTTHFSSNFELKRQVNDFLISTCQRAITQVFHDNYKAIFANFMVKEGGGQNPMPLHADWTYVDEKQYESYAIWIPLIDTSIGNGCLSVIPFSHYLSHHIRGPRILQWNYPTNEELINAFGIPIPILAGNAILYNHRLLHYSEPNLTNFRRVALNISLVPHNTPLLHFTIPEGESEILKFAPENSEFYIQYNNFQMPILGNCISKLNPLEVYTFDNSYQHFIEKHKNDFNAIYKSIKIKPSNNIINQLLHKLFKYES
jgi:hypothetical protein